jgi:ABC-type branched-subunit amino acid transport system substrate-binding protein
MIRKFGGSTAVQVATAFVIAAGLSACGADADDNSTADSGQHFEGKPVYVITLAPIDTPAVNTPEVLNAATGAVRFINDAGGLNKHEVKLIACNDGNDPNKAAGCARQAVDKQAIAVVGGFTTNGSTIMPVLKKAGIPWIGGYGLSPDELKDEGSFLLRSGAAAFAGVGAKAVDDGCDSITTVLYDTPATGNAIALVNAGLAARKAPPAKNIKVPTTTTDFSSVAKAAGEADCTILGLPDDQTVAVAVAGKALGVKTRYYLLAGLSDSTIKQANGALAGAVSVTNFVDGSDPAWNDAKKARDDVDWTAGSGQNTWAAYRVLATVMKDQPTLSAKAVMQAMSTATKVDADGLIAPVDFKTPFGVPGLERVYNRHVLFTKESDGDLVSDGDFVDIGPLFGQ